MVRFQVGHLLVAPAIFIVMGSIVIAQALAGAPPRVQITLELDRFAGNSDYAWSDIEVEQPISAVAQDELTFTELPRDVDLGTLELHAINGQPAPAATEQRFWPADDSAENHLQRHVGNEVTVTTTSGDVVGLLRAVEKDWIAIEVGATLRVLRRGSYVQDVRFATSKWRRNSAVTWRLPPATLASSKAATTPSSMTVRYRTRSVSAEQTISAAIDNHANTVDISASVTLRNRTEVAIGRAEIVVRSTATDVGPKTALRLPQSVELPPRSVITVPMMPPLPKLKTARIAFAYMGDRGWAAQARPECEWRDPSQDGAIATALEFATPPGLRIARTPVRTRAAHATAVTVEEQPSWIQIANGQGLITLGASPVSIEHNQVDCTADQANQTVRETIGLELTNTSSGPVVVIVEEQLLRSSLWKLETSNPIATAQSTTLRFRTLVPGNGKKKLSYTVVYSW